VASEVRGVAVRHRRRKLNSQNLGRDRSRLQQLNVEQCNRNVCIIEISMLRSASGAACSAPPPDSPLCPHVRMFKTPAFGQASVPERSPHDAARHPMGYAGHRTLVGRDLDY
jgi:hypothetical protein